MYGNSLGFLAGSAGTSHSISCSLIAQQAEEMQRDYWYSSARDATELDTPELIGRRAGERAVARLGSRKLTTRKAPIAYSPDMARGLFRHFIGAIRGASQYRKASFLLNAAGEEVFPSFLQMQERPHIPKGLASAPFDGEGAATHDRDLVRDGVLQGYVLGSYSARKLGLKTTGNAGGVHNLIVAAPGKALDMDSFLDANEHRLVGYRDDGAGCQRRDRRLLARRQRLLGGRRRHHVPGARDHDRRQPEADVSGHRGNRQRC